MLLGLLDIYMHCHGARAVHQRVLAGSGHGAASRPYSQYVVRVQGSSWRENGWGLAFQRSGT